MPATGVYSVTVPGVVAGWDAMRSRFGTTCNQAGPNCINVTSGNDPTRWFNQVALGLRYQHNFGLVDFSGSNRVVLLN